MAGGKSYANHMQPIERLSSTSCHVTCHMIQRDSSTVRFDRVLTAFVLALSDWLNHELMKEGRVLEYRKKTPDDELQKMPQTKDLIQALIET